MSEGAPRQDRTAPPGIDPVTGAWLALAVGLGFLLRVRGVSFGLPFVYHPDEVFMDHFTLATLSHRFQYHFPFYDNLQTLILGIVHGVRMAISMVTGHAQSPPAYLSMHLADPTVFVLVGRSLSVLAGTAGVLAACWLARLLHPGRLSVAAAFFAAVATHGVQESHYLKGHALTATLMALGLALILRTAAEPTRRHRLLTGIALGLAFAGKPYSIVLLVPFLLCVVSTPGFGIRPFAGTCMTIGITYLVASPGVALYPGHCLANRQMVAGEMDVPYLDPQGWPMWLFLWHTGMRLSLGAPIVILSLGGLLTGLLARRREMVLTGSFVVAYTILLDRSPGFFRYLLPLELVVSGLAACGLARLLEARSWIPSGAAAALLIPLLIAVPLRRDLAFDRLILAPDTRSSAFAWLQQGLPGKAHVAVEGMESPFLVSLVGPQLPPSPRRLDRELGALEPGESGRLLAAIRDAGERTRGRRDLEVTNVTRLDEDSGNGAVWPDLKPLLSRGVTHLVSTGWIPRRRVPDRRYEAGFQGDLDRRCELLRTFAPTHEMPWDPVGWRMDYTVLDRMALSGDGLVQGPLIRIYRVRLPGSSPPTSSTTGPQTTP